MRPRSKKRRSQEAEKLTDATGLGGSGSQPSTVSLCNSTNEEYIRKNLGSDDTPSASLEDKSESKSRKRKRAKTSYVKALETALAAMVEQMKTKNDLLELEMGMQQMEQSLKREEDCLLLECMNILDEMEVDEAGFTRSLQYLHDHPTYQKVFMLMSDSRRREWVDILMKN